MSGKRLMLRNRQRTPGKQKSIGRILSSKTKKTSCKALLNERSPTFSSIIYFPSNPRVSAMARNCLVNEAKDIYTSRTLGELKKPTFHM